MRRQLIGARIARATGSTVRKSAPVRMRAIGRTAALASVAAGLATFAAAQSIGFQLPLMNGGRQVGSQAITCRTQPYMTSDGYINCEPAVGNDQYQGYIRKSFENPGMQLIQKCIQSNTKLFYPDGYLASCITDYNEAIPNPEGIYRCQSYGRIVFDRNGLFLPDRSDCRPTL